jgi:hypothetical protein
LLMFKVDFEKAYDSVEWSYLLSIMTKWIFCRNGEDGSLNVFVRLLLRC